MASGDDDALPEQVPEPIRFRPSTRRKAYRRRIDDRENDNDNGNPSQPQTQRISHDTPSPLPPPMDSTDKMDEDEDEDHNETAALAALRARASRRGRLQGVGFRAGGAVTGSGGRDRTAGPLVPFARNEGDGDDDDDEEVNPLLNMQSRFTHQTGILNDVDDRHMNAYIESRLSSRRPEYDNETKDQGEDRDSRGQDPARNGPERPIIQGKIVEVDIAGDEGARNGGHRAQSPAKKQRLGPDGKPWRSRKRRGSNDVKRDQLVEEFLHENRLDIYEAPTQSTPTDEADGAADKRLADEFRRQYMDDIAKRRQQRKKKPTQVPKPRAENVLRGPKLGGSRNTRAAVRNILLQQKKDEKK